MKNRLTILFIIFQVTTTLGQMHISSVPRPVKKQIANQRTEAEHLFLPFWDDFSTSVNNPDPSKWENSDDVFISDGLGIKPPTLNVASFDGLDAAGKAYSQDPLSDGITDILTSRLIDLSNLFISDDVFFSFFYQIKGNGEIPNDNDSLRLEFKDLNGSWNKIWSVSGKSAQADTFLLIKLKMVNDAYLHPDFQFRFKSYGRQSGPFDTWHIDYVYMNDHVTSFYFPDRAIRTKPTSIFKNYTSIPIHHFNQNPGQYLEYLTAEAFNLFDSLQPSNFTVLADIISLQKDLTILTDKDTLAYEQFSSFPDPLRTGIQHITLTSNKLLDPLKVNSDTLATINLSLFMNTDDNQWPDYQPEFVPLDFRVNDTIHTTQILHDYYAYDDGTAEFGAGLNFAGDMVAYAFPMAHGLPDTLVSVDMYFPNIGSNSSGQLIELFIWNVLKNDQTGILYQEPITLRGSGINEFQNYALSKPVVVRDTFYIGWRQSVAGNIDIGLDKNTDSGDRMYYNLDGNWQQNTKVRGSLMLRPRFGKADVILGLKEDAPRHNYRIYPNPGRGHFTIEGPAEQIAVYNSMGQLINVGATKNSSEQFTVNLTGYQSGIYFFRIKSKDTIITRKVILR